MSLVDYYERVVDELRQLFLKARIGLYNVLPRFYRCEETRERISLFNYMFEHASRRMKNVFCIRQYKEFIDETRGCLRQDMYGTLGLHLKPKGN